MFKAQAQRPMRPSQDRFSNSPSPERELPAVPDIQTILDELKRLPLRDGSIIHLRADYLRRVLRYLETLERHREECPLSRSPDDPQVK